MVVYIYNHPNKGNNAGTYGNLGRVEHGQYVFPKNAVGSGFANLVTYDINGVRREDSLVTSSNPIWNYLVDIRVFNKQVYGSHNHHAKSGGVMYTIRNNATLFSEAGGSITTLNAGDVVIIGPTPPQGTYGADNRIRMWGFKRGGRSGADVETYNLWIESGYKAGARNYPINTK